GSAQVGGDNLVAEAEVILADSRKGHDARVVNHDVDASEFRAGFIEEALDIRRTRNIRLNGDSIAADPLEFCHDFFCFRCVAQIVHNNRETILGQPLRHCPPDSTRCSGYDRDLLHCSSSTFLSLSDNLFAFPSTRGRTPDSSQSSCHPPRSLLETSLRRDL